MSHENIRKITIENDKVFLTSVANNVKPQVFATWECEPFSKILTEEGRDALLAKIGEEIWNGEMHLQGGNKLCKCFLTAHSALPGNMNFSNFDSKTVGKYLAKMVRKLEENPAADISADVEEMLALRNNREHILESTRREGWNFLNGAGLELQQDRDLALEVVKAGGSCAWFSYPNQFKKDKGFAMEALKLNGCFYRELDETLRQDRDIIRLAFQEIPGRQFHEHLPDLIPLSAYSDVNDPAHSIDKDFIFELLEICPPIHLDRAPGLLNDREVALKWCEVGRFFPHSIMDLPDQYLKDEEFQNILCDRFKGTDKYDYLMQNFALRGVLILDPSIDHKIRSAKERQLKQQTHEQDHKKHEEQR